MNDMSKMTRREYALLLVWGSATAATATGFAVAMAEVVSGAL